MNKSPDDKKYIDMRVSLIRKHLRDIKHITWAVISKQMEVQKMDLYSISDSCDIIDATLDYIEEELKEEE